MHWEGVIMAPVLASELQRGDIDTADNRKREQQREQGLAVGHVREVLISASTAARLAAVRSAMQ